MKARLLTGFTALVLAAATATGIQAPHASAAASRPAALAAGARLAAASPPAPYISAKVASSWQTNGTVWALAVARGRVYVGGQYTSVRPPGAAPGTGETSRTYLSVYSTKTGNLLSVDPIIAGGSGAEVTALAVSGNTLYVGGNFTTVNGSFRDNLAAFDISTTSPTLTSWAPKAFGSVLTIHPSANGSTIYLGGDFNELDGTARTFAGAVNDAGSLLPWAPVLDNTVTSIAAPASGSQVLVGGYFQTINGVVQNAVGAVDPVNGTANQPWTANIVPFNPPKCTSAVKDIVVSGSTAYVSAEGTGGGCFDGDLAVTLGSTDTLAWQNDCLGATQALVVVDGFLYKGSHAHDCDYAPGGFPQVDNGLGAGIDHHLLDQSLTDGSLGHWTPNTTSPTGGLGPRVMATDGHELFVGGDFTAVNGQRQQGFARFGAGPDTATPAAPAQPTVMSTAAGVESVTFTTVSTPDVGKLTYTIYRSGRTAPLGTVTATSWPWALPVLHFRNAKLRPGSTYSYSLTVSDGTSTSARSPASVPVIVSAKNPPHSYVQTVLDGQPSFFWQLNQASGHTAVDSSAHLFDGIYRPGTTLRAPGPITGSSATATTFDGIKGLVTAVHKVESPQAFTIEGWFKATTNTGGKLIGFGSKQTGSSTSFDRQIYLLNDGQLVFGVQDGAHEVIESANVYNDNRWHYVAATFTSTASSGAMALYVDGQLIGTQATTGPALSYGGYWRVGGDNLSGWGLDPQAISQATTAPNSYYFRGSIGDVAVYPVALSAAQVAAHYAANALSH